MLNELTTDFDIRYSIGIAPGAGLDTDVIIAEFNVIVNAQINNFVLTPTEVSSLMRDSYYNECKNGIILGVDVAAGGIKSLLNTSFLGNNTPEVINNMAQTISDYWHTVNTPGTPAHGGTSVTNVTTDLDYLDIEVAINSIITTSLTVNGIGDLLNAINDTVKNATFYVTETVNGSPVIFEEHLS